SGLGPGGGDPVAGVLEGVGRQVHETAAGRPGDGDAADVQLGGGGQGAFRAAVVAAERAGDDGGVPAQLVQGFLHAAGEHRVGAGLHEDAVPLPGQRRHGAVEAHGPAQILVPVGRV